MTSRSDRPYGLAVALHVMHGASMGSEAAFVLNSVAEPMLRGRR